jgi:AraC family transcriptional regulator
VIFIGLFSKPVPEGLLLYGTLLSSEGLFCFKNVNLGMYYLMATSVSWEMESSDVLLPDKFAPINLLL